MPCCNYPILVFVLRGGTRERMGWKAGIFLWWLFEHLRWMTAARPHEEMQLESGLPCGPNSLHLAGLQFEYL